MYIEGFFTYLRYEKRYSPHTIEAYRNDLEQFSEYLHQEFAHTDTDMLDVHHRQVRGWVVSLMQASITAKSVNRKLSSLKSYYRYLLRREIITKDPMARITAPKLPKNLPVFVEEKSMGELFDVIDKMYPADSEMGIFIRLRDTLIMELLYATGMRRAELLSLTDRSFDHAQKNVKVLGKGNKERIIPVSPALLQAVDQYIVERNKLFGSAEVLLVSDTGKKAYPRMIYNIVHRILAEVTTLVRKSPHVLRHTFATHLSNKGAELNAIKELLGHASLASTQVYTHNTIEKLKEIHRLAHPKG